MLVFDKDGKAETNTLLLADDTFFPACMLSRATDTHCRTRTCPIAGRKQQ